MKSTATRCFSLLLALLLVLSLAGCGSAPAVVGTINGQELPAGLYLALQFNAYSDAASWPGGAVDDPLSATLTVEGEELSGREFVDRRTRESVADYAAALALFDELGGSLTPQDEAEVKQYADELWQTNHTLYEENGIGQASLTAYVEYTAKRQALLDLVYGPQGTQPVSREELTAFVTAQYRQVLSVSFPLMDYATAAILSAEDDTRMTELAQIAAGQLQAGEAPEEVAAQLLPQAFSLLGMEYTPEAAAGSVSETVFAPSTMDYYGDSVREALLAAQPGEALVLDVGGSRLAALVQPLTADANTEELRQSALFELKGDALEDLLAQRAQELEIQLDESALKAYSPDHIKTA